MKPFMLLILPLMALSSSLFAKQEIYTIGIVPQFDTRHIEKVWRPILDDVEKKTGVKFRIEGSSTIPAFEDQFLRGRFDFAYMNPYHALQAAEAHLYEPLVRDVERKLYGIIVVRKDSGIKKVEDLDGKLIAFPAPNALGASLIPRAEFARDYKIKIKPKYVQSHSSVYLNVILGRAAAGGGVQKSLSQQKESVRNKLQIIHKTPEFAPHPLVVHKRVDKEVREKVLRAFLQLGESEIGRGMLRKIPIMKIGRATLQDYKPIERFGLEEFYQR
jgi:phosphonate transport system substrate-binding protein